MAEIPLKNEIIGWLKCCKYWFQYSGNQLLEYENVNEDLVNKAYHLFKEDYGLKPIEEGRTNIEFKEISAVSPTSEGHLQLQLIWNIENVNALASGQSIQINPKLTIIYGGNG